MEDHVERGLIQSVIFVTGATGFVGRHVVRQLLGRGQKLRLALHRGSQVPAYFTSDAEVVETEDLFSVGTGWLEEALRGVDTVIHLAWYAEPGKYLTSRKNLACLDGTLKLASACAPAGVKRFVGVGTCAEYDLSTEPIRADAPLKPQTLYAACKAASFQVLTPLLSDTAVEFAWCRLFYLYGEGEDGRRLGPQLRQRLSQGQRVELTSGTQIRDYLDVASASSLITDVALGGQQGPINICSGIPVSVREFAERIADEFGRRDLLEFGKRPENLFDPPYLVGIPNVRQGVADAEL